MLEAASLPISKCGTKYMYRAFDGLFPQKFLPAFAPAAGHRKPLEVRQHTLAVIRIESAATGVRSA